MASLEFGFAIQYIAKDIFYCIFKYEQKAKIISKNYKYLFKMIL